MTRGPFHESGGDIIRMGIGRIPDEAIVDLIENMEARFDAWTQAGEIEAVMFVKAEILSLQRAVASAQRYRRASGGLRAIGGAR